MRLILVCAALVLGVAVGDLRGAREPWPLGAGAVLALFAALAARRQPTLVWGALLTSAVALGLARAAQVAVEQAVLAPLYGHTVRVRVTLIDAPAPTASGSAAQVLVASPDLAARRLRVLGDASLLAYAPGDQLTLQGRLRAPSGPGPPTLWFPSEVAPPARAPPSIETTAAEWRAGAVGAIRRRLDEPAASLASGVLLGGMPRDPALRMQLQRSGLAHFVAIDGYKQLLMAGLVASVTTRAFGAFWGRVPVLLAVTGYTLLSGAHPSAVRSAIMVGLATLATLRGRTSDALTGVCVATALMALTDPPVLLDVGLQLSVSATLGLILLWPRLRRRLRGVPHPISEPAGVTLAVTLATLPVELAVFQSVSLASPLAHVVAVPLLPLVFCGAALLVVVAPCGPLAALVGWLVGLPTTLLGHVIAIFGNLPGAAVSTPRLAPELATLVALALLAYGVWGLPELRQLKSGLTTSAARPGAPG